MASGDSQESLRRSKRNKYHLDLTALNLVNPERRKQSTPILKEELMETSSAAASPGTSNEKAPEIATDDSTKRSRRPTTKNASFVYADESEDEDEKVVSGMIGNYKCDKCPSRFESRPGLANHIRLHGRSDKRKFGCDQCDFSCGSAKAIRNHKRIHSRGPYKEDSEVPTNSDNRSDTSDSHTPPLLTPVRTAESGQNTQETPPPKLAAISPQAKLVERSGNRKRHRCEECPYTVRSRRRFEAHMSMHEKATGFQCFYCTLSTSSSGFLKRHMVEIHKKTDFPWPPKWLGGAKKAAPAVQEARRTKRGLLLMREIRQDGEKMACPVADCTYTGYTRSQIVLHKRRCHLKKPRRREHRCCTCGLRLRTVGALRVHRIAKHPKRKMAAKAKKLLYRETCPNSDIMRIMREMRKVTVVTGGTPAAAEKSVPSTPKAPSPALSTSQCAPALLESETVSSSLLGVDLPDCLTNMTFGIAELAAELAKSQDNEFRCDDCPFTTNARTKLERHTVKHEVKSDIQCPLCSFSCRGDDLIKQHVRLHMAIIHKKTQDEAEKTVGDASTPSKVAPETPAEAQPATPKVNGEIASERKKTTLKRKKHSNVFINKDGIRMRRCLECPYVTKHACDLASHYNMHVSEPQRYKCTQCTYSTKRAVSLKTHFQCHKEHNEEFAKVKPWHIKANGFNIGTRTGLGKNRIYTCKNCPFVTKGLVLLHQHNRHHVFTKGAAYKCSKCPFYSMQCEVVEDHILIHSEMDVQTERLVPLTRGKRNLDEAMGRITPVTRGRRTPKQSAASSPAPPVLVKEEPMDWKGIESEENSRHTSASRDSKTESVLSLHKPLSVAVQEFIRPEPALMKILRREQRAEEMGQCPECPYQESDELMMRLHRECHLGQPRLHKCDLCSFSCMAPEALHKHISLHVPALSPNSEAQQRKKHAQRRRAAGTEIIPHGVPHFSCNRCTFKSLTKDGYQEHMMFHAQELQRRLMTTIKRANTDQKKKEEDEKKAKVAKRAPKKSDKFHACRLCSFRCETENAFLRHSEMHGRTIGHKCEICNYMAPTYSITLFHMMNHHSDQTLASLTKSAVLVPKEISMKVERSEERIQKMADNVYTCNRCPGFICYEILQLRRHYEANHCESPEDQNAVESLAMGMLPRNSIVTTA